MIISEGAELGRLDDLGQASPTIKVRLIDNLGRPVKGVRVLLSDHVTFEPLIDVKNIPVSDRNGNLTVAVDPKLVVAGHGGDLGPLSVGGKWSPLLFKIADPLNPPGDVITFVNTPDKPKTKTKTNTGLYIGIGAAVLAVGTLVTLYLVKE